MAAPFLGDEPSLLKSLLNLPPELCMVIIEMLIIEMLVERALGDVLSTKKDKLGDLLNLSLTCKTLEACCAPMYYKRVVLASLGDAVSFLQCMLRRPTLGRYVRILHSRNLGHFTEGQVREIEAVATEVIESDSVAVNLLSNGVVGVPELLLFRILRNLPELRQLRAVRNIAMLVEWPEADRLCGSSLIRLQLTRSSQSLRYYVGSWIRAFQPGFEPTALESFDWHEDVLAPHGTNIDDELRRSKSSLQHLGLYRVDPETFSNACNMFQYYPLITSLYVSIRRANVRVHDVLAPIASSSLVATLQVLEIHAICVDGERSTAQTFPYLQMFTGLLSLKIPLDAMQYLEDHTTPWPPSLVSLTFSRADLTGVPAIMVKAVMAGTLPTSLRTIALEWYTAQTRRVVTDDKATGDKADAVKALNVACAGKGIALLHTVEAPVRRL